MIYTFTNWQCIGFFIIGFVLGASALASVSLAAAKQVALGGKRVGVEILFWLMIVAMIGLGIYMHNPIVGGG